MSKERVKDEEIIKFVFYDDVTSKVRSSSVLKRHSNASNSIPGTKALATSSSRRTTVQRPRHFPGLADDRRLKINWSAFCRCQNVTPSNRSSFKHGIDAHRRRLRHRRSRRQRRHVVFGINRENEQAKSRWGGTAIAQWIRLCLPSCYSPGFKSQADYLGTF